MDPKPNRREVRRLKKWILEVANPAVRSATRKNRKSGELTYAHVSAWRDYGYLSKDHAFRELCRVALECDPDGPYTRMLQSRKASLEDRGTLPHADRKPASSYAANPGEAQIRVLHILEGGIRIACQHCEWSFDFPSGPLADQNTVADHASTHGLAPPDMSGLADLPDDGSIPSSFFGKAPDLPPRHEPEELREQIREAQLSLAAALDSGSEASNDPRKLIVIFDELADAYQHVTGLAHRYRRYSDMPQPADDPEGYRALLLDMSEALVRYVNMPPTELARLHGLVHASCDHVTGLPTNTDIGTLESVRWLVEDSVDWATLERHPAELLPGWQSPYPADIPRPTSVEDTIQGAAEWATQEPSPTCAYVDFEIVEQNPAHAHSAIGMVVKESGWPETGPHAICVTCQSVLDDPPGWRAAVDIAGFYIATVPAVKDEPLPTIAARVVADTHDKLHQGWRLDESPDLDHDSTSAVLESMAETVPGPIHFARQR